MEEIFITLADAIMEGLGRPEQQPYPLKWVDRFVGQYQDAAQEHPIITPAVYLELFVLESTQQSAGVVDSRVQLRVHVVQRWTTDGHQTMYDQEDPQRLNERREHVRKMYQFVDEVHKVVANFNGCGLASLFRAGLAPDITPDSLVVDVMTYEGTHTDEQALIEARKNKVEVQCWDEEIAKAIGPEAGPEA